jgi:hypothetical protein
MHHSCRTEVIGLLLVKELLQHAFPDIPTIGSEGEEMGSVQIPPPATIASLNLRPLPRWVFRVDAGCTYGGAAEQC